MSTPTYNTLSDAGAPPTAGDDHNAAHGDRPPSGWDYVFAFSAPSSLSAPPSSRRAARADSARRYLLAQLRRAGFAYSQLWLPANALYLVRVALPPPALMEKAERMGLRLPLRRRFGGGYMAFTRAHADCFENAGDGAAAADDAAAYFTPAQRLRITLATINSREPWGVDMSINRLFRKGVLRQAHALHSRPERRALLHDVVLSRTAWPWRGASRAGLDALKDYFGPRIAIYLSWLVFYTRMLTGFAAVSVAMYIGVEYWLEPRGGRRVLWVADMLRILYGVSISFWSTYWLEHWQRRNAVLNARWGLTDDLDYAVNEIRQDFRGVDIPGFYSQGGFVHLSDLAATSAMDSDSSSEGEGGEDSQILTEGDPGVDEIAVRSQGAQDPEAPGEAVDPGDSQHREKEWLLTRIIRRHRQRGEGDDESFSWSGYTDSVASDAGDDLAPGQMFNRLFGGTVAAAARLEDPHERVDGHDYVIVGGEKDEDFKILAPVTGAKFEDVPRFPFFNPREHRKRVLLSGMVTAFFAAVIAALSFCITFFKRDFNVFLGYDSNANGPSGFATAVLIISADGLWRFVSTELVKWENHHSNQSFENSLIRKRFAFQFVSNYFSLFYIAFIKPFTPNDPCVFDVNGKPDCMGELGATVLTIVATKATLEQLLEVGIPYLIYMMNSGIRKAGTQRLTLFHTDEREELLAHGAVLDDGKNEAESGGGGDDADDVHASVSESKRPEYENTIDDYTEVVILHGFIALFGMSCPLVAAVALASNLVEFRLDCFKMLAVFQRPTAEYAVSIGEWAQILQALSTMSVLTMVGMTTITSRAFHRLFPTVFGKAAGDHPIISFLIFEHVLLFVRWAVGNLINEVPGSTYRLKMRREFLIAKFFDVGWKPHFRGPRSDVHKKHQ